MITFKEFYLQGFCSVNKLSLSLDKKEISVIRGANGSGKSSIFIGLVWTLYGKNIKADKNVANRKVINNVNTWKKHQPKGYEGTVGTIYWEKDGELHKVTRCQGYKGDVNGAKGGDRLVYEIDAVEVSEKRKPEIQALIEKNLGMSYQLFMSSVMFGQGLTRLIKESGTDKKNLFEEIFELGYLSEAKSIAKEKFEEYNSICLSLELEISKLESDISTWKEVMSSQQKYEDTFNQRKKQRLRELKSELKVLIKERDSIDYSQDKYDEVWAESQRLVKLKQKYDNLAREALKKTEISLEEFLDRVIKLLERQSPQDALRLLKNTKQYFIDIEKNQAKAKKYGDKHLISREAHYTESRKQSKLESLETKIDRLTHDIDKEQASEFKPENNDYSEQIKRAKKNIKQAKDKLGDKTKDKLTYKWVLDNPLGNNGLKTFLFESSLTQLNEVLDTYSEALGFHLQFTVDLNSQRKDFETLINLSGNLAEYEELSGGQKTLCNLAMAFAMNTVIGMSKGVNISFLDEIFETLDSDNIDIVINLIRQVYKDKSLFIITHQDSLPIPNSKTIQVSQEKGLSIYR